MSVPTVTSLIVVVVWLVGPAVGIGMVTLKGQYVLSSSL